MRYDYLLTNTLCFIHAINIVESFLFYIYFIFYLICCSMKFYLFRGVLDSFVLSMIRIFNSCYYIRYYLLALSNLFFLMRVLYTRRVVITVVLLFMYITYLVV